MEKIYSNRNIDYLKGLIALLPEQPGIYQYFDTEGTIIYIGKAKSLKRRVASYFNKVPENRKTALLVRNIADIRHMVVDTEEDALLLENNLIKKHQPRYNIRLKDDKSFPWICIKNERFPRVFKTRNVIRDGSEYFGPFTSWLTVSSLMEMFRKTFKLRTCNYFLTSENIEKGKFKICLEYHLGNCNAPCAGLIDEKSYNEAIIRIKDILKGNISGVIRQFKTAMIQSAAEYRYEEALLYKQRITELEKYQSKSTIVNSSISDVDVYSIDTVEKFAVVNYLKIIRGAIVQTYSLEIRKNMDETKEELLLMGIVEIRQKIYSNAKEILVPFKMPQVLKEIRFVVPVKGDKFKLMELSRKNAVYYRLEKEKQAALVHPLHNAERILDKLKQDLHLSDIPVRIECFDNSNIQGNFPVAACVVFINGKPAKREYRHFNVKTVEGPDDFASMEEIITRRFKRQLDEKQPLPQLVVIDGGKGQLSAAVQALDKIGLRGKISVIGIAKKLEEIYFPGDTIPLYLDKKSESLKLLQQLRDEAHRFGITFHRQKRSANFTVSELENINGIGKETSRKLLTKFKSVRNLKEVPFSELQKEIGNAKAVLVRDYLAKQDNINTD
ncbi:MAG TPA: excinuclease ABC subunit UvrC [Prolixibacteraceae bacterium]|nr:excinuclease ABC subunit UvrC [Prolixibacteraceae bacterium]